MAGRSNAPCPTGMWPPQSAMADKLPLAKLLESPSAERGLALALVVVRAVVRAVRPASKLARQLW